MNKKGFTILELMIIASIVGILAGIVAPQICLFLENSKRAKRGLSPLTSPSNLRSDRDGRYNLPLSDSAAR